MSKDVSSPKSRRSRRLSSIKFTVTNNLNINVMKWVNQQKKNQKKIKKN